MVRVAQEGSRLLVDTAGLGITLLDEVVTFLWDGLDLVTPEKQFGLPFISTLHQRGGTSKRTVLGMAAADTAPICKRSKPSATTCDLSRCIIEMGIEWLAWVSSARYVGLMR